MPLNSDVICPINYQVTSRFSMKSQGKQRDIAELVGVIAVVFSLLFLAYETRQGNLITKGLAFQARSDAIWEMQLRIAESESLMEIATKLKHGKSGGAYDQEIVDALSDQEWLTWRGVLSAHMFRMSTLAYQSDLGLFESDYRDGPLALAVRWYAPKWKQFEIPIADGELRDMMEEYSDNDT